MSVQTAYTDAPLIGMHGELTDLGNPHRTHHSVTEEAIPVGVGVAKGTDLTGAMNSFGFGIKLPDTYASDVIVGIAVRIAELEGNPENTQASIPTYGSGDLITFVDRGAIWIKAAKAIPAGRNPVYVVADSGSAYDLGTLLPDSDTSQALLLTGAYFEKQAAINTIVKVVLGA